MGLKEPNAFGTYDMLGNLMEICADRGTKGGAYDTAKDYCEPTLTGEIESGFADDAYGFRVARDP